MFSETSAKLLGFGYVFTIVNPQVLKAAASLAGWKRDIWPLKHALAVFEDASLDLTVALQLTAGFLVALYQDSLLSDVQGPITARVLEHLAKRNGGLEGIRRLKAALPQRFGVNLLGLMVAAKTIDAWLNANSSPLYL